MDGGTNMMLTPVIQYGFAGMSVALLGIVMWLMNRLLLVLHDTNVVIQRLTDSFVQTQAILVEQVDSLRFLREQILTRPCFLKGECKPSN